MTSTDEQLRTIAHREIPVPTLAAELMAALDAALAAPGANPFIACSVNDLLRHPRWNESPDIHKQLLASQILTLRQYAQQPEFERRNMTALSRRTLLAALEDGGDPVIR